MRIKFQQSILIGVTGLAAWLLFYIQPLTGQILTPRMGGSPTSWLLVMLWFQIALFLGTLISHLLSNVALKLHLATLTVLLIPALFWGTIYGSPEQTIEVKSGWDVLNQLWGILGFAPILLGMVTASAARAYSINQDSAPIFVASNIGSLLGLILALLSDMFLNSDTAHNIQQSVTGILIVGLAIATIKAGIVKKEQAFKGFGKYAFMKVVIFAALGCALLNVITTKVSTDMGAVPFTWLPPLTLFLLSYIFAFWRGDKYIKQLRQVGAIAIIVLLALPLIQMHPLSAMLITLALAAVIWCTLHSTLASYRPNNSNKQALFTVGISLGGIIGGSITAVLFPIMLKSNADLLIVLTLVAVSLTNITLGKIKPTEKIYGYLTIILVITYYFSSLELRGFLLLIYIILAITLTERGLILACIIFSILAVNIEGKSVIVRTRDYFGTLKVTQTGKGENYTRTLVHGTTIHGSQSINSGKFDTTPAGYYDKGGPLGDIIDKNVETILCIGLGVGAIQGYNRDTTFIEIDPAVVTTANNYFGFINDQSTIIIGDGRIKTKELTRQFDLIILDAFTSDAIPLHLLTVEALATYIKALKPNGRIIIHISNRYYDLEPLLANNAKYLNYRAYSRIDIESSRKPSHWVVLQNSTSIPANWHAIIEKHKEIWTDKKGSLIWLLKNPFTNHGTKPYNN